MQKGYSILEFARPEIMAKDTIQVSLMKNQNKDLLCVFGEIEKEIQRGIFLFEYSPIPTTMDFIQHTLTHLIQSLLYDLTYLI